MELLDSQGTADNSTPRLFRLTTALPFLLWSRSSLNQLYSTSNPGRITLPCTYVSSRNSRLTPSGRQAHNPPLFGSPLDHTSRAFSLSRHVAFHRRIGDSSSYYRSIVFPATMSSKMWEVDPETRSKVSGTGATGIVKWGERTHLTSLPFLTTKSSFL